MRSKAIQEFLIHNAVGYLSKLYTPTMEVQVNVGQDGGEVELNKGRKIFSDGLSKWSSFRMPRNAMGDPENNDYEINWDFAGHVSEIGMTGWDYGAKVSRWVGFDFDSIAGHTKTGLTNNELQNVIKQVEDLPWVQVVRSTGGNGLHLYVHLPAVPTSNHAEHAALGRAILSKMSGLTGFDFSNAVDVCGQILWVWARRSKGNARSFELLKKARPMGKDEVPLDWKDHIGVVKGTSRRSKMGQIPDGEVSEMELLTGQYPRISLDEQHKELLRYLDDSESVWWWDKDMHMLVTHTFALQRAHKELKLRGLFATNSSGSSEQNCFAFPLPEGAWVVRRHGRGVQEHPSWDIDDSGWRRCYYNQKPTLKVAARMHGGQEHPKGGWYFKKAEDLAAALTTLNMPIDIANEFGSHEAVVKTNNKNKVIVEIPKSPQDNPLGLPGFIAEKNKFTKVIGTLFEAPEEPIPDCDDTIRHLVGIDVRDAGWVIHGQEAWREEPVQHVRMYLDSTGLATNESKEVLGRCVANPWYLTNQPFKPEYPGGRKWNRDAARLNFEYDKTKTERHHPTWDSIMAHCGDDLDTAVQHDNWCFENDVHTGKDYLMLWCASMLQYPERPLPYLFFFGEQNSGKSTFHETLSMLFNRGYVLAHQSLTNQQGFNGELQSAVLCAVEEVDLRVGNSQAYNRIKEWVTNKHILIHPKGKQVFQVENSTHWVQCANSFEYCPVFKGDSRIVVIETQQLPPSKLLPRYELIALLQKEASDFLTTLMSLTVPHSRARLNIPVIETDNKSAMIEQSKSSLDSFISDNCIEVKGASTSFKDFYEAFMRYCDPSEHAYWTKIRVSKTLPLKFPTGGLARASNQRHIGNIVFKTATNILPGPKKYVNREGKLVFGE